MQELDLTHEQARLLGEGAFAVNACPGSGKTLAIVRRFVLRAETANRGIGLLSFTNKAIDEIRERTSVNPGVTRPPHYVGNFDSFIRHFVVTPEFVRSQGYMPNYWRSWEDMSEGVTVRLGRGGGLGIWNFRWDQNGGIYLAEESLSYEEGIYWRSVRNEPNAKSRIERYAKRVIDSFMSVGNMDAAAARAMGMRILRGERGKELLQKLSLRFEEVIVDEAQDCDPSEHAVLEMLQEAGVALVMVADPDQQIFGFRGVAEGAYDEFVRSWPEDKKLSFTRNFRSSSEICSLVSSLCSSGRNTESEFGADGSIAVLAGSSGFQRTKFVEIIAERKLATHKAIVLANRKKDARELAGGPSTNRGSRAKVARVLLAASLIQDQGLSSRERCDALLALESLVLDTVAWPKELAGAETSRKLQHLGLSRDWLRVVAAGLLKVVVNAAGRSECGASVRSFLLQEFSARNIQTIDLSASFRAVSEDIWTEWTTVREVADGTLKYQTIHSAKGGQWESVLLRLEGSHGIKALRDWHSGIASEERRVLYVGASRPERFLALAVGQPNLPLLRDVLERDAIPFSLIEEV